MQNLEHTTPTPPLPISCRKAAEVLIEFNKWRRAEGVYDKVGYPFPYCAATLGQAIDKAVEILNNNI